MGPAATVGTVTAIDTSGVASGAPPQLIISGSNTEVPITSVSQVTFPAAPSTSTTGSTGTSTGTSGSPTTPATTTTP